MFVFILFREQMRIIVGSTGHSKGWGFQESDIPGGGEKAMIWQE